MDCMIFLCNAQGISPSFDVIWVWSCEAVRIFPSETNEEILALIGMHINTGVPSVILLSWSTSLHVSTFDLRWAQTPDRVEQLCHSPFKNRQANKMNLT